MTSADRARRANARVCANPVCGRMVDPEADGSIEVRQCQRKGSAPVAASWSVCGLSCARQFLNLSALKERAAAEVES